jgi:hypothetical protein
LSRQVADGRSLIITVGHSRMVAQTIRELAAKRKADVDKVDNDHAAAGFASTLLLAQRSTWWDDVARDLKIPRTDRLWDVDQRIPRQPVAAGPSVPEPPGESSGPVDQVSDDVVPKRTPDS